VNTQEDKFIIERKNIEKMKIKTAKYITVLDFEVARVFRYTISEWTGGPVIDWNPDYESCEDFLTNKGHNLTNCEWMVHAIAGIINNNDGNYGKL